MDRQNKKKRNIVIGVVVGLVLLAAIIVTIVLLVNHHNNANPNNSNDEVTVVEDAGGQINLATLTNNLKIEHGGTYALTGEMKEGLAVEVETNEAVTIRLENATINANNGAAIASIGEGKLTIEIADNSLNKLRDGGESDYDACIYVQGPLTIDGNTGTLIVNGRQYEGNGIRSRQNIAINGGTIYLSGLKASIDADNGYAIHGGLVAALGSNTTDEPDNESRQHTIAIMLDKVYDMGDKVELEDAVGETVMSFDANEGFRDLVLSNAQIQDGTYTLKIDSTTIQTITMTDTVTVVDAR